MISRTRRTFIVQTAGLCAALAAGTGAFAAAPLVDENDAAATTPGNPPKATTNDAGKFPKYQAGQTCSNSRFYKAGAGESSGTCPMFGGKAVAAEGWCNVYAKLA